MKRLLTFLTVLFATLTAFAQGDSPYARFGYEGKVEVVQLNETV